MPGVDFHHSDHLRTQAHECGGHAAALARPETAQKTPEKRWHGHRTQQDAIPWQPPFLGAPSSSPLEGGRGGCLQPFNRHRSRM